MEAVGVGVYVVEGVEEIVGVHRLIRDGGRAAEATNAINLRKSGRCRSPASVLQTPGRADLFPDWLLSSAAHVWSLRGRARPLPWRSVTFGRRRADRSRLDRDYFPEIASRPPIFLANALGCVTPVLPK